jgi:transcription antitermination factor NusB
LKKRTRARELALQFLYQLDLRGPEVLGEAGRFVRSEEQDASAREFALAIVRGVQERRDELDAVIRGVAQNWEIKRMAVIDRNVLRLATWELLHCPDIPPKVSINEAIELGKRFSTQNSGGFINGILDKIKERREASGDAGSAPAASANDGAAVAPGAPGAQDAPQAQGAPGARGTPGA